MKPEQPSTNMENMGDIHQKRDIHHDSEYVPESAPTNGASILHTNDAETGNASYVRGYKTGRDAAIADVVAWLEKRGRYYQHRGDTCLDFRRIAFEDHGDVLVEIADAIERGEHNNNAVTSQEPRNT